MALADESHSPLLRRLPSTVSSLLRSTVQLPTISSIVRSLVHNALDAGATDVRVTVDLSACEVECIDDGAGFHLDLFRNGSLQRYTRSNVANAARQVHYGTHGEALASMAAIGLLVIETRTKTDEQQPSEWTHIQRGDQVVYSGTTPDDQPRRIRTGSTVTVKDIYHSVPLRRPSRLDDAEQRSELEACKRQVMLIALREPTKRFELMAVARHPGSRADKCLIRCEKVSDIKTRFAGMLYPSHAHEAIQVAGVHNFQGGTELHVTAVIVPTPRSSAPHQCIYLQGHLLPANTPLLEFWPSVAGVDQLSAVTRSSPGTRPRSRSRPASAIPQKETSLHRRVTDCIAGALAGSAPGGIAPAYIVDLQLKDTQGSLPDEHTLGPVICSVIEGALIQRGFISNQKHRQRPATMSSVLSLNTAKRRCTRNSRPSTAASVNSTLPMAFPARFKKQEQHQKYTDPVTKRTYWIDVRTGNSYPCNSRAVSSVTEAVKSSRKSLADEGKGKGDDGTAAPPPPTWLVNVLEQWDNPVLPRQAMTLEPPIPVLNVDNPSETGGLRGAGAHRLALPHLQMKSAFFEKPPEEDSHCDCDADDRGGGGGAVASSLSTSSLADARVIAQVSNKFIAAVLPSCGGSARRPQSQDVLVAIDQHAADERVRYERIMEEYFADCASADESASYKLKEPIEVWVPRMDAESLLDNLDVSASASASGRALSYWGFGLGVREGEGEGGETATTTRPSLERRILITHVPRILSDRLRTDVGSLQTILSDLAQDPNPSVPSATATATGGNHAWPQVLAHIPRTLLDLLKSKACRGAIMFNDPLTLEQCERLVVQLSECRWPFICAHGRPSVVPLCGIGAGGAGSRCTRRSNKEDVRWENVLRLGGSV